MDIKTDRYTIPFVCIAVSGQCNLSCRYCPTLGDGCDATSDHMPAKTASKILAALRKFGVKEIRLSGKEPLLNPDIQTIIESALENDFEQVRININGALPAQPLLHFVKDNFVVIIKLDTCDQKADLWLHHREIADIAIDNIRLCVDHNVRTRINTVVTSTTQTNIPQLASILMEFPVRHKLLDLHHYPDIEPFYNSEKYHVWQVPFPFPERILRSYSYRAEFGYGLDSALYETGYNMSKRSSQYGSSRFAGFCRNCRFYKCQEGLYHIYCSQSGIIRPCKKSGPEFIPDDIQSEEAILRAIRRAVDAMNEGVHFSKAMNCLSLDRSPYAGRQPETGHYDKN